VTVDPLVGRVLGDAFQIEQPLGEGGFGAVYVARHVRTQKLYAVKVLRPERANTSAEAVERFRREADALAALGHPGIVAIHDFAQTEDGIDYLVMDLLHGEDLAKRLLRTGRMPFESARDLIRQIGAALGAAHRSGIVHRDLKPANVFLASADGVPDRPMILDFGLVKFADGARVEEQSLTTSGVAMGTPMYMSPEQASGAPLDHRTDIYALGTIFFELCAGGPPFEAPTMPTLMVKILTTPPPRLSAKADVPPYVDDVLARALAKNPDERFDDVESFLSALDGRAVAPTRAAVGAFIPDTRSLPAAGAPTTERDAAVSSSRWSMAGPTPGGVSVARPAARRGGAVTRLLPIAVGVLGLIVAALAVGWVAWRSPELGTTVTVSDVVEPRPVVAEAPAPVDETVDEVEPPAPPPIEADEVDEGDSSTEASAPASMRSGRRPSAAGAPSVATAPAPVPTPAAPAAVVPSGGLTAAQIEGFRAQADAYERQVREIESFVAVLPRLRRDLAGLSSGREPPLCGGASRQALSVRSEVQIVVSTAQSLRNEIDRICAPFERVDNPPPEVRQQFARIASTLDRAEQMAQDRSISTNTPTHVADQVVAAVREARRVLDGVEQGRKPFPCDAAVFSQLRRLGSAGNVWSGAAADRVTRMRDQICRRLGVDRSQLTQNATQFERRLEDAEGALRQTQRAFQRIVDQYRAYVP
jgi:serine/threonine-protein kinase